MTGDIPQLSPDENASLTSHFLEKEIFDAISQMERKKALGSDGFIAKFYGRCWEITKTGFLPMSKDLLNDDLSLFLLNFGIIIFLPKKEEAIPIERSRPICLLNLSFKIFTKTK